MKNVVNSSRGHSQKVPKILRAPVYRMRCAVIFAIAQLTCLFRFCCWFLSFFFSAPNLWGRFVDCQILTHVRWWPEFVHLGQQFWAIPQEIGSRKTSKFGANFGHLHNLIAYISGTNISEQKTALQTAIFPAHADLIGWTLVHKWRKTGKKFWLT